MSTELEIRQTDADFYERYRALSTAAVASLIVGVLSCLAVLDWMLVALPLIGIPLSIYAVVQGQTAQRRVGRGGFGPGGLGFVAVVRRVGPGLADV